MFTAYDYEAQRWVQGEAARTLLIEQAESELAILQQSDEEGRRYLNWIGADPNTLSERIATIEACLSDLRGETYSIS